MKNNQARKESNLTIIHKVKNGINLRKFYVIFILFSVSFITTMNVSAQQKDEVLTNTSVINLFKKGLSSSIIVNKIKSTKSNFDVSTDALINLAEQKVPDEIVNAMVEASGSSSAVKFSDPNDPLSVHESGIYLLTGDKKDLKELEPTVCSQGKTNAAAQMLVSGFINSKQKTTLSGREARLQVDASNNNPPVFYFYFDPGKNSLNSSTVSWGFQNATSPNEFMLVRLDMKKNSREITTGKANAVGSESGVDSKQVILFDYDKVAPGIYKVTPREKLKPAEYCWMYAGHTSKDQGAKVYDFGVTDFSISRNN